MILNDTEIELVRRFHESDLSEEELNFIGDRIESESDFRTEVERLGLVRDTIIQLVAHQEEVEIKPDFLETKKGLFKSKRIKKLSLLSIALALFTVVAIVAVGIIYLQYVQFDNKHQIFADCETYTYSISSDIMRSDHSNINNIILNKDDEIFLQGIIDSYKNDDLEMAKKQALSLQQVSKDITTQEIVSWWLVTIYLKNNNIKDAKIILNTISKHPDFNSKSNAIEILEEI